jgi:hypothetical protein
MTVTRIGSEMLVDTSNVDAAREIDVAQAELFGTLWAPSSLGEFAALIQWDYLGPGDVSGWRGQADASWPLHSSAQRRLMNQPRAWLLDTDAVTESALREFEKRLLNVSRLAGHGRADGGKHTDLELLGRLQHHGAATRLVDFTSNAFVALWFACRSFPDTWGIVFGVQLEGCWRVGDEQRLQTPMADLMENADGGMMAWRPSALSPRMPAQSGFFLWSEVRPRCPWSSLGPSEWSAPDPANISQLDGRFAAIAISPGLKRWMVERWERVLGISEQTLFPDFDGFATANSPIQPLDYTFWADS